MKKFFKIFGKGVLGVVLLPFIIVFFALYLIYCFFLYLYQAVKSIVIFFQGKDYAAKLKEEIEAEEKMTNKVYNPVTEQFEDKKDEEEKEEPEEKKEETKQVVYQQNIIMNGDPSSVDTNKLMDDFVNQDVDKLENKGTEEVKEISLVDEEKDDE